MPKVRVQKKLPSRRKCGWCGKDAYADEVAAALALDYLSKNPARGQAEPVRFYRCPKTPRYHLTSQPFMAEPEIREIKHSA